MSPNNKLKLGKRNRLPDTGVGGGKNNGN